MSKKLILLIGAPGSGKTSNATLVTEKYVKSISSYSTGDLIQQEIQNKTAVGNISKYYVEKGDLIPTGIVLELIVETVKNAPTDVVLLDGFPGKEKELQYFSDYIFNHNEIELVSVIEVKVSHATAKERSLASDISEEVFEHKMESYIRTIQDIEKYYEDKDKLKVIDGEKDLDAVASDISAHLESVFTSL